MLSKADMTPNEWLINLSRNFRHARKSDPGYHRLRAELKAEVAAANDGAYKGIDPNVLHRAERQIIETSNSSKRERSARKRKANHHSNRTKGSSRKEQQPSLAKKVDTLIKVLFQKKQIELSPAEITGFLRAENLIRAGFHGYRYDDPSRNPRTEYLAGALVALAKTPIFEHLNKLLRLDSRTKTKIDTASERFLSESSYAALDSAWHLQTARDQVNAFLSNNLNPRRSKRQQSKFLKEATGVARLKPRRAIEPLHELWTKVTQPIKRTASQRKKEKKANPRTYQRPRHVDWLAEAENLDGNREEKTRARKTHTDAAGFDLGQQSKTVSSSETSLPSITSDGELSYPALLGFSQALRLILDAPNAKTDTQAFERYCKGVLSALAKTPLLSSLYRNLGFNKSRVDTTLTQATEKFFNEANPRYQALREARHSSNQDGESKALRKSLAKTARTIQRDLEASDHNEPETIQLMKELRETLNRPVPTTAEIAA